MFTTTNAFSIKHLNLSNSKEIIQPIQKNLEILRIPVKNTNSNTIEYDISGLQLSLFQMGKVIKMYKQAKIQYKPEKSEIEFTVSHQKLIFIALFLFIVNSALLTFLSQSIYGIAVSFALSFFIFSANYFYGISSFKKFLIKSIKGEKMLLM